jgi:hypothetical protein
VLRYFVNIRQSTSGGDHTLMRGRTRGQGPDPFQNVHGAGYRGVYDFADPDSSVFIIATGQSGHFLSAPLRRSGAALAARRIYPDVAGHLGDPGARRLAQLALLPCFGVRGRNAAIQRGNTCHTRLGQWQDGGRFYNSSNRAFCIAVQRTVRSNPSSVWVSVSTTS